MRVPVLEQTQQITRPAYSGPGPQLMRPNTALGDALGNAASAVGTAGANIERSVSEDERAKKEAEELQRAQKLQELQNDFDRYTIGDSSRKARIDDAFDATDTSRGGFLATKGLDASAQSADVLEQMERRRQEIADTIGDQTSRTRFLVDTDHLALTYRRQVEHHVAREFEVAKVSTAKGLEDQHLAAAEAGLTDPETLRVSRALIAEKMKALAPSEEAGTAAAGDFASKAHAASVAGMLARGRVAEAAKYADENADGLGSRFANVKDQVKRAQVGVEKTAAKLEAESLAIEILKSAKQPDGYLDGPKALAALGDVPPASRVYVRTIINEQVGADAKRKKADIDGWKNDARTALNHGKSFSAIPGPLIAKLEEYGQAEYVNRLRHDAETDARRNRVRASGSATEKRSLEKAQHATNELALSKFRELSKPEQAATDVDDFLAGMGVDELGRSHVAGAKTRAKEYVDRDGGRHADAFTRFAKEEGKRLQILPKGKTKGADEAVQRAFLSEAQQAYDDKAQELGKPPSLDEQLKLIEDLAVKHKGGWFEGGGITPKTTFEFERRAAERAAGASPTPKSAAAAVQMKFPDGKVYTVPSDKVEAARRKGGVRVTP